MPTLEDLRVSAQAAWLWDVARGRLVWANAPAIRLFDGQSLFDLIDRPFDMTEPGLEALAQVVHQLPRGEIQDLQLEFPSVGLTNVIPCRCSVHALADGRDGVLAVHITPATAATNDSYEDIPAAVCTLAESGVMLSANATAKSLFEADHLQQLLVDAQQADLLLQRLQRTNLVSTIATFNSRFGQREARLTLRRAGALKDTFAVMIIEDVTERRQLERQFSDAKPAALAPEEKQAFEDLGRKLTEAVVEKPAKPALPKPQPALFAQAPIAPQSSLGLPVPLQKALERNPAAFAITQNGKPAYVSTNLVRMLGFASADVLLNDASVWQALSEAGDILGLPSGKQFRTTAVTMPWLNGKAQQITFTKHEQVQEVAPLPQTKINNENLQSILDIAADGIVTLDATGNVLTFSAGAEAIFGYRNAEVFQKPLSTYLSSDSAKTLKDYLSGLAGAGLASVFNDGREVQGIVKQGGHVPLFLNIGRLPSEHAPAAYCAVLRDLTSWKRTEKDLREARDAAENASKHKSEFLARVSHELRTPLNAIMGFSEIMRLGQFGEMKNERYRGYVNDIHASGSHLLAMINDLLDLSKIESGRMELNFTAVDINDCFDHAARQLQEQATRARVLVRKSFPENLPRIVADLKTMRQILANLLSNAIKYTDPGGQVIVSTNLAKTGALTLRLKDTGIGMKADELAQALQPFSRVDTPGRERQGTGLGLPLTKALVEANRAGFAISSEPGQGTLIEITFPTTRVLAE